MGKRTRKGTGKSAAASAADLIGTAAAAKELGVSQPTLRRWLAERRIQALKVGKQWRFRRSDLASMVAVAPPPAVAEAPAADPSQFRARGQKVDELLRARGVSKARADQFDRHMLSEFPFGQAEPPALSLLGKLLLLAVSSQVSDLHFEPTSSGGRVRQRIDGLLHPVIELPPGVLRALTDQIKSMGAMNPAERTRPQDGRTMIQVEDRTVDFRVNVMPALHGEVVAVRFLDRAVAQLHLDKLGLEPEELERYGRLIHRPCGLIILSGPAGSGKTTTLYATLTQHIHPGVKVMTAEDPVEYELEGIVQVQYNPAVGFDQARALRSILRQAPNIIATGDVQSTEVASILVQSALTGHMTYGTMHTNSAIDAALRLVEMGVPAHLVSSSVLATSSQRLVRLICPDCKTSGKPDARLLDALEFEGADRGQPLAYGKGCSRCNGTGYRGRGLIFELLEFTDAVREALHRSQRSAIEEAARSSGWRPLPEIARAKILRGETGIEEVVRVL